MEPFYVDLWSDVVCPFCYVGLKQFEEALDGFAHKEAVVLRTRAFELDTRTPATVDTPLAELVARKYNMDLEQVHTFHSRLETQAAEVGAEIHFDRARVANSFDAHRLIALAGSQGKDVAMAERLFRAYFAEGHVISDRGVLATLGAEVGVEDVESLWTSDAFSEDVRSDENQALDLGFSGVPTFVLDGKFVVSGAQGVATFTNALERAWNRRHSVSAGT